MAITAAKLAISQTTVKNTSGVAKFFGFIPPHGKKLPLNGSYNFYGTLLNTMDEDDVRSRRKHAPLSAALDRGDITIIKTPYTYLQDSGSGLTKELKVTSGTLGVQNVSY